MQRTIFSLRPTRLSNSLHTSIPSRQMIALCLLLSLLALAGCNSTTALQTKTRATSTATPGKLSYGPFSPQEPNPFAYVTFTSLTSYADALRVITDLGLQPLSPCIGTNEGNRVEWVPPGESDAYAADLHAGAKPILWVYASGRSAGNPDVSLYYTAPSDWPLQLSQASAVTFVSERNARCTPLGIDSTPVAGKRYFINLAQTPTYMRVTFTEATPYDQALTTISQLGFRLANPCYEQAQPRPAWHSMGQGQAFAASKSLVIATTGANSSVWQQQLQSSAGVATLMTPYHPACAM